MPSHSNKQKTRPKIQDDVFDPQLHQFGQSHLNFKAPMWLPILAAWFILVAVIVYVVGKHIGCLL